MPSPRFVSVALDIPLLPPLTYKVMDGTSPKIGDRCVVPIGNRSAVGLIVGVSNQTDIAEEKQKSYIRLLNEGVRGKLAEADEICVGLLSTLLGRSGHCCLTAFFSQQART